MTDPPGPPADEPEDSEDCTQPDDSDPQDHCGAQAATGRRCLAHLDSGACAAYLAALEPGSDVDASGVTFTPELLNELLRALTDDDGIIEFGTTEFSDATFTGTARFYDVTFAGTAGFAGATFAGNAWFEGRARRLDLQGAAVEGELEVVMAANEVLAPRRPDPAGRPVHVRHRPAPPAAGLADPAPHHRTCPPRPCRPGHPQPRQTLTSKTN